jgi:predicted porin
MKKSLLALSVLGAFAGVAHAQSSVTLYGIIDQGINYVSNVKTATGSGHLINMSSGVMQGSRWGLRGVEDLGGGLKAVFVLENGFDLGSGALGQGGLFLGRQAYVGLGSSQYGTVTLGRQYDSVVDYVGPLVAADQWSGYFGAKPGDLDNFNNAYRTNNAVKFTSVNYAGLQFGGMYSLGGQAGNLSENQTWSLGGSYSNGPLSLAVAYLNARTPSNAGGLMGNNTSTSTPGAIKTPVYSGFTNANTYQVIGAAGNYTFGAATFGLNYSNVSFRNLGANGATIFERGANATFNNAEVNFRYQFTPFLVGGLAFDYTDRGSVAKANGTSSGTARYFQYQIGTDYFLSKRTDLYFIGVYQHASGTDSTGGAAVADINNLTPASGPNQFVGRVGIRHKF